MDLSGYPAPADAPEPGACVRVEQPETGLAVVVFDPPHRSFPVLDAPTLRDLAAVVARLERDAALRGIVFTGRRHDQFLAGADVQAIGSITDPALVEGAVFAVHELFDRIARLRPRTVAAVGGPVPGGAYELSLACDFIVATDDARTRIGLPETMLGIIPAWGGTHRLPRRVGLPNALDAILTGRLFPAPVARKRGMVDRLTKPEYLVRVASDIALGRIPAQRARRGWKAWAIDRNPIARYVISNKALEGVEAKARGKYPAPYAALDLLMSAQGAPHLRWAKREAAVAGRLATGPVCKSLVSIFFASEDAKKLGREPDGTAPPALEHAAVVGAGVMGAAIAGVLAEKGVRVRLADLASDALDRALFEHRAEVEKKRRKRRLSNSAANAALDRFDTTTELGSMGRAQLVVEAAAEVLEVKRKILGELAQVVANDAILATNTSSLSVDAIAEGLPCPERVVGMHFFNPVRKMPLVEVVRGAHTSQEVVTATCALALRLGKTPVVTRDVPGFLVNRVLGPYLDEAVRLFQGGADPARVDHLLLDFGMPMGPFALLDEVGFDIAAHAAQSLCAGYGERMTPSSGIDALMSPERLGKKTGLGFYRHPDPDDRRARPVLADDLPSFRTGDFARHLSDEEIVDRLVLAMLNEGARCLAEEVVAGPRELDLATVFGTGFAPFRGGLLRYGDARGLVGVLGRLELIHQADDVRERGGAAARFAAADLIRELAASGGRFHERASAGEAAA
jgi:3-hydroxyacyl-CoA dehydrogenase/enoyl-CoA hydratase/3-hydroxybutyryl-CoA epimerase